MEHNQEGPRMLLNQREVAEALGITRNQLRWLLDKCSEVLPDPVYLGREHLWSASELPQFRRVLQADQRARQDT